MSVYCGRFGYRNYACFGISWYLYRTTYVKVALRLGK
ncbi:hypothetical protein F383_30390 [Gossypium arboreum]|uniref:Uncharacterized protein n=1 Tax=Gossypium arboreum TaxID=29729 RepID=A0A0B0N2Z1_GOSAR|nr:hypothetical protein F383_30390 [Gossypium arboreum]